MFSIQFIFLPTTLHFFLNYLNLNYFLLVLYYHNSTFVILLQASSLSLVSHDVYIYFLPTLVCEMYKSCEFDPFFFNPFKSWLNFYSSHRYKQSFHVFQADEIWENKLRFCTVDIFLLDLGFSVVIAVGYHWELSTQTCAI